MPARDFRILTVAKRSSQSYRPGKTKWQKIRTRVTAEAVVGGVLGSLKHPDALVVGLPDLSGRLRIAGRTGPLPLALQRDIPELLIAAGGTHPWPEVIPSSRFGQRPSKPVDYTRVLPSLVVELDVDMAFEQHRWRHAARLVRLRRDLAADDLERQER
jgi:hypothetical protein